MNMEIYRKRESKNGFTLAELLVVVAILAILVAVSIPIFTGKLEAAKKATDDANARAAKAVGAEAVLSGEVIADGIEGKVQVIKLEDLAELGVFYYLEDGTLYSYYSSYQDSAPSRNSAPENACIGKSASNKEKKLMVQIHGIKGVYNIRVYWLD